MLRGAWLAAAVGAVALVAGARDDPPVHVQDDRTLPLTACDRGTPAAKGAAALRLVRYDVAPLDYTIEFRGPHRRYLAMTYTGQDRIEVWVRPCQSVASVASVLGHELGHAVDDRYMTDERRREYLAIRGISPRPWFGCNRCTDFATPAGDFAEAFASLHTSHHWRSKLGRPPRGDEAARLMAFFAPVPPTTTTTTTTTVAPTTTTTRRCLLYFGDCLVPG